MFPAKEDLADAPYSEIRVYEFLENLPDTFFIFHSVQWVKRGNKWKSTWKENDFLILNQKLGALVLEVKGGDIEYKNAVFHQINSRTRDVAILDPTKKKDPLSQAIDGVYHYRSLLDKISSELENRFPIEAAVWFSTSEIRSKLPCFPLKYREVSGAVLGDEDFLKGSRAIYEVFEFYKNHAKTNVSEDEFKKIIELIAIDFELISAPLALKGELDRSFIKMTNEQAGLLDYIAEQTNATIQGAAGTGKTLIAKEAAKRFALEGRKVLFLCFNKYLFIDLMHRYPQENVSYYNINTLIQKYNPGTHVTSARERVVALYKIEWNELEFDDVVIDEAQDFENDEIIYFKDLAEFRQGHFFVFYDKNQLVTTRTVPECARRIN